MLTIEYVEIDKLKMNPRNPRKNADSVAGIVKSIESFGFVNPLLVRRANNQIVAGHTRLLAARDKGMDKVPVVYLDLDETDSEVYAIFDNKSVENTEWDGLKLAELFAEFDELNVDLSLTGFDKLGIDDIVLGPMGMPEQGEGVGDDMPSQERCQTCGQLLPKVAADA